MALGAPVGYRTHAGLLAKLRRMGRALCDMELQGIRCSGQAGEQKRMTLYEKPLTEHALSSMLLLFAAIDSILNTIETEVMIHVHQGRILAPTPHLLKSPRPACHYDGVVALLSHYKNHAGVASHFLEWRAKRRLLCGTEEWDSLPPTRVACRER